MGSLQSALVLGIMLSTFACFVTQGYTRDYDVGKYGAVGDGVRDDSNAFLKAWNDVCNSTEDHISTMVIPGKTFLLNPVTFAGPCKAATIGIQIDGTLIAPKNPAIWNGIDASLWISFEQVSGLRVSGRGTLDGQGSEWWDQSCRYRSTKGCTRLAPTAIKFIKCNDGHLRDVHIINSPQTHILVMGCISFDIANIHIASPETSPNTDGIHLQSSQHVTIQNTNIQSGDDCISIGDQILDVKINTINCGPGHGISIGSLGIGGTEAAVEDIHVSDVNFVKTMNGVRIKTYQVGKGYARGITFKKLNFTSAGNPIIIDQYYCAVPGACQSTNTGVKVSNVTYENAFGTSSTQVAITLNCSQAVSCTGLTFGTIKLSPANDGEKLTSNCMHAYGNTIGSIQPTIPCLAKGN